MNLIRFQCAFVFLLTSLILKSQGDDLPWTNDCSIEVCPSWVFGNGSSIAGAPWEGIDLNFECSLDGPAGPYNQWAGGIGDMQPAAPMNSTTAGNGLLIVDSDLFGLDANYDASWIENSWVQTSTPINCSANEAVQISFQTRYRCWDNGSSDDSEKCLIEISRDGVNWPDISSFSELEGTVDYGDGPIDSRFEVFPGFESGSQTNNPDIINLDISSAAGGQEEVWLRFRWAGTWGYSWEIDDIVIDAPPESDLRIADYSSFTDFLNTGMLEYGVIPIGQIPAVLGAVLAENAGTNFQTGVGLNVNINGQNIAASEQIQLAYGEEQLISVGYSLPNEIGNYEIELEIFSDLTDETPMNNGALSNVEMSQYTYARDNGLMSGLFPNDGSMNFIALNRFDIYNDVTIYAVDVAVAATSDDGTPIQAHLYDSNDPSFLNESYGGLISSSPVLSLNQDFTNTDNQTQVTWYTLVLDEPYTAVIGDAISVGFEHFGGENVQIGEAQAAYNNTSFYNGQFGGGGEFGWYFTNETPMIRMNLDPEAANTSSPGCTNEMACNFSSTATEDDGSCIYPGCQDSTATNYDPVAGCASECIYLTYDCSSIGLAAWSNEEIGLFPEWQQALQGVEWEGEWVFNVPETVVEPQSGVSYDVHHVEWGLAEGLPDWLDSSGFALGELNANSQYCISASGIPNSPDINEIMVSAEVFISIFGQAFSIGEQTFSSWLEVIENPNPIPGCTYPTALNYLAFASDDDGSCLFAGCTDENAGNFNSLATIDDGSCCDDCDANTDSNCAADNDGDGVVTVSDLLILLGEFGTACE